MERRLFWGSLFFVMMLSFLGLLLSGIFWNSPSTGIIAAAIAGTFLIACAWLAISERDRSGGLFLLRALMFTVGLWMFAALACSMWFTLAAHDFGFPGVLGVAAALSVGAVVLIGANSLRQTLARAA